MGILLDRYCFTGASKALTTGVGILTAMSSAQSADFPVVEKAPQLVQTIAPAWTTAIASEVRYYSWKGNRGTPASINRNPGSGTQIYTPYALQVTGNPNDLFKVEFLGRGGWVESRQTTNGTTGKVATHTDTVVSGTVTYLGLNGIQPFISTNANLPTGKSVLPGAQANARMDSDLVEIGSFGEGWNFGPTVGVNVSLTPSFILTMAGGYTWRGSFDRENSLAATPGTPQALSNLDPGDVFTGTISLAYANGPWSASIIGTVSEETETEEGGVPFYKAGRRYLASASLGYAWAENLGITTVTASIAHSNRNEITFLDASSLVTEPFNTNSNLKRIGVEHLWAFGPLWMGPTASYLHRDNNAYDSMTLQYVPAKQRYAAGVAARYAASDKVTFNLRGEHIWLREEPTFAINGQQFSVLANAFVLGPAVPVVSSTGWQIAGGFNVRF